MLYNTNLVYNIIIKIQIIKFIIMCYSVYFTNTSSILTTDYFNF